MIFIKDSTEGCNFFNPISNTIFKYIIFLSLMFIMTLLSIIWLSPQNTDNPTFWSLCCAIINFFIGGVFICKILVDMFHPVKLHKKVIGTKSSIFRDFNESVPEAKSIFEQFKSNVKKGEIKPKTPLFDDQINEIAADYNSLIKDYFNKKSKDFFIVIIIGMISVILIFSFFYIADYTVETYLNKNPGFNNTMVKEGNILTCFVDGLYYSVVTFGSLGYGDIHPGKSVLARIISILEILVFLIFFGIGVSYILTSAPMSATLTSENLESTLRDELEIAAEEAQI